MPDNTNGKPVFVFDSSKTYTSDEVKKLMDDANEAIKRRTNAIEERKKIEEEHNKLKKQIEDAEKEDQKKKGEFEKLYKAAADQNTQLQERLKQIEEANKGRLESLQKKVHKEKQSLIPEGLSVEATIAFIEKNEKLLFENAPVNLNNPNPQLQKPTNNGLPNISDIWANKELSFDQKVQKSLQAAEPIIQAANNAAG